MTEKILHQQTLTLEHDRKIYSDKHYIFGHVQWLMFVGVKFFGHVHQILVMLIRSSEYSSSKRM